MKARAVNPRKPHEMTKAERCFESSTVAAGFAALRYEAITLRAGDVRYTPDFSGLDAEGQVHFFEVKASGHRAAYTEAARLKLNVFAGAFSEYVFWVVWPDKGELSGWHVERLDRRPIT